MVGYLRQLDAPALIGFEATGNYHRPLAYFLHAQGFALRLIPTMALARTREAMHNSWDKNDPKDAQVILHMLKTGLTQTWHDPLVSGELFFEPFAHRPAHHPAREQVQDHRQVQPALQRP